MRRAEQLADVIDHNADVLAVIKVSKQYESCPSVSSVNCLISELAI